MGLFRWWKTKTAKSNWATAAWKIDDKHKYGTGQGACPGGETGEWLPMLSCIYWGFELNPHPVGNPSHSLYTHDVGEIRHDLKRKGVIGWND